MPKRPGLHNGVPIPYDAELDDLRRMVKAPGPQAWAACMALGHKTDEAAFEALEDLAVLDDWRYRRAAIEAMAFHRLAITRSGFFCRYLTDPSSYVVRTACTIVAQLGLDCAHNALRKLVHSNDAGVRSAALRALKEFWQPSDFDLVFEVFRNDMSKKVRYEAAWILRRNVDGSNWERIFELWRIDSLHRHRVWACELAYEFGDCSYAPSLGVMLEDSDGHVRVAASRALEKLSH